MPWLSPKNTESRSTVISTDEMERPEYLRNDAARCYHCKDELFTAMEAYRQRYGFDAIAYGVNVDDQGDYRPGQQAARLHQVAAPLLEAGLTKEDIRQLASQAGLRIWNKPASACLSSRIEYGRPVTREALSAVEQGEDALRQLGFRQVRVRHHGEIARIEIAREELPRAMTMEMAAEFTRIFKALGFSYVTLDLEGFRSGSMNALLPLQSLVGPQDAPALTLAGRGASKFWNVALPGFACDGLPATLPRRVSEPFSMR